MLNASHVVKGGRMMYYYKVLNVNVCDDYDERDDYSSVFVESRFSAKKDDYLVYMNYANVPCIGKVTGFISELDALTMDFSFNEVLTALDVKGYLEKKKTEVQELKLIKAMKAQADKDKLIEDMRKKANGSPEMQKLFAEYEKLIGAKANTSVNGKGETEEQTTIV